MFRKIVLGITFILAAIYGAVVLAGVIEHERVEDDGQAGTAAVNTTDAKYQGTVLSAEEVAKHKTSADCWIIVSNKVYDISGYFGGHPGGNNTMLASCGTNATDSFETKGGGGGDHSSRAYSLLEGYLLGTLGETIGQTKTSTSTSQKTKTTTAPQTVTSTTSSSTKLTAAEVAKHNSASSCWVILSGGVYNLTSFRGSHSGGAGTIPCGVDATSTIVNRHGSTYISLLAGYKIGVLGATVTVKTITDTTKTTPPSSPEDDEKDEEDEEDDD